jgi:Sec-independent protein translocase protein TatA
MFDVIGFDEIVLVCLLALLLFNSRDMVRIAKFLGQQYRKLEGYYYRLKAEMLSEPPTPEQIAKAREIDKFYEDYHKKMGYTKESGKPTSEPAEKNESEPPAAAPVAAAGQPTAPVIPEQAPVPLSADGHQ